MQWRVDLHPVTGEWRVVDREGEIVCVSLHGEQHLAKIAAAPDMFEALWQCIGALKALGAQDGYASTAAKAALAKAEGLGQRADANSKNPPDEKSPVTEATGLSEIAAQRQPEAEHG